MSEDKPLSFFRRVMADTGAGDPQWKRAAIVASVLALGLMPLLWTWLASLLSFR